MIIVAIVNPLDGQASKIGTEGELPVVVHPHPPFEDEASFLPFRGFFTDDGTPTGSKDMRVLGTLSNPISFYIESLDEEDIYIKTISIVIADAGATLSKFGAIPALINGIEFIYQSQSDGDTIINDAIKSNFDFIQQANGQPSFGDGNNVFRAANVVGSSEAYIPTINLADVFGLPYGVRIKSNSLDRLTFRVRDNITALDRFDIVAYGGRLKK